MKKLVKAKVSSFFSSLGWRDAIYAAVIVGLVVFLCISLHKGTVLIPQNKPVVITREKDGTINSEIAVTQVDQRTIRVLTDSISTLLDGRNEITEVTTYIQEMDTVFVKVPVYVDTNDNFSMAVEDPYISLNVSGNLRDEHGNIKLKHKDTLTYVSQTEKHLFSSNIEKVNILSKSPYNTIVEGGSIRVKVPKSIVVFGPSIGAQYIDGKIAPYVGVGATLNLFSIKSK